MRRVLLFLLLALAALGCSLSTHLGDKLTETSAHLNLAARLGQAELAMMRVRASARESYLSAHRDWGRALRVVDLEPGPMLLRGTTTAELPLGVSWQRADEGELRETQLKQRWSYDRGTWILDEEAYVSGARGLLAEPPDGSLPSASALPMGLTLPSSRGQFRTHVIPAQEEPEDAVIAP